MGKTLATIRTNVRRLINEETANQWSDEELLSCINEGQNFLMSEIMKINKNYMVTRATTPTVVGQIDYAMPTDMFGNWFLGLWYQSGINGVREEIRYTTSDEVMSLQSETGAPEVYCTVKDSFIIGPSPDGVYTLTLWYPVVPTPLSLDTDQTVFNDEDVPIVEYWSAIKALDRYGMPGTDRLSDKLKVLVAQINRNLIPRDTLTRKPGCVY